MQSCRLELEFGTKSSQVMLLRRTAMLDLQFVRRNQKDLLTAEFAEKGRREREEMQFHFGNRCDFLGYPPSPRSSGIMDLGEILEIIYGAQSLAGKIFILKGLARIEHFPVLLSPWLVWARRIASFNDSRHTRV